MFLSRPPQAAGMVDRETGNLYLERNPFRLNRLVL